MGEEITENYYVRRREFLNEEPSLPAFIIGIVQDTRAIPDDDRDSWNGGTITLDLADCYRRVMFDFSIVRCRRTRQQPAKDHADRRGCKRRTRGHRNGS